jgi:hypothetical protein
MYASRMQGCAVLHESEVDLRMGSPVPFSLDSSFEGIEAETEQAA